MNRNAEGKLLLKGLTLKEIGSLLFLATVVIGIVGNSLYQNHLEDLKKDRQIQQLQVASKIYESKFLICIKGYEIFPFFYDNNPRSPERLTQVLEGFNKIFDSDCLRLQGDKIYTNPYKGTKLSSLGEANRTPIEEEVFQGMLYEVDEGIPFLVTGGSICADGSYSGSVGSGTCSWHGGYAGQRGDRFEFKKSTYEPDPRVELQTLQGN